MAILPICRYADIGDCRYADIDKKCRYADKNIGTPLEKTLLYWSSFEFLRKCFPHYLSPHPTRGGGGATTLTAKAYFQNLAELNSVLEVLCKTIKSLSREINNNLIITISVNSSTGHTHVSLRKKPAYT